MNSRLFFKHSLVPFFIATAGLQALVVTGAIYYCNVSSVTFSPAAGKYSAPQNVSLSAKASNGSRVSIYYTTYRSAAERVIPTCSRGSLYSSSLLVDSNKTIEAIACSSSCIASAAKASVYGIETPSVTFHPAGGKYSSLLNVTLSTSQAGAKIYYTADGRTTPVCGQSQLFVGKHITLTQNMHIKAIACSDGLSPSAVASANYEFNLPPLHLMQTEPLDPSQKSINALYYVTSGFSSWSGRAYSPLTVSDGYLAKTVAPFGRNGSNHYVCYDEQRADNPLLQQTVIAKLGGYSHKIEASAESISGSECTGMFIHANEFYAIMRVKKDDGKYYRSVNRVAAGTMQELFYFDDSGWDGNYSGAKFTVRGITADLDGNYFVLGQWAPNSFQLFKVLKGATGSAPVIPLNAKFETDYAQNIGHGLTYSNNTLYFSLAQLDGTANSAVKIYSVNLAEKSPAPILMRKLDGLNPYRLSSPYADGALPDEFTWIGTGHFYETPGANYMYCTRSDDSLRCFGKTNDTTKFDWIGFRILGFSSSVQTCDLGPYNCSSCLESVAFGRGSLADVSETNYQNSTDTCRAQIRLENNQYVGSVKCTNGVEIKSFRFSAQ